MTTSLDLLLAAAVRDRILAMQPCPVPSTTLSGPVSAGAASLPVANAANFARDVVAQFADGTAEGPLAIGNPTTTTALPLKPAAMGGHGCAYAHQAGAVVYSNLYDYRLVNPGPNLALGWPLLELGVLRQAGSAVYTAWGWMYGFVLHVQYSMKLLAPEGSAWDDNIWGGKQQALARQQLDDIAEALKGVHDLTTQGPTFHIGAAPKISVGGDDETRDWTNLVGDVGTLDFTAALQLLWYTDKTS